MITSFEMNKLCKIDQMNYDSVRALNVKFLAHAFVMYMPTSDEYKKSQKN